MLRKNILDNRIIKRKYYIFTNSNNYNRRNIIPWINPNYPDDAWEAIDG
jgi:hypothetical protein